MAVPSFRRRQSGDSMEKGNDLPQCQGQDVGVRRSGLRAMDQAFQQASATLNDDAVMGLPKPRPTWIVPAVIGMVAVLVGVLGAVLFLR